jgi:hypothetical protein
LGVRVSPPAPFFPKYENLTAERLFPNDISFGDGVCFAMRLLWCGQDPGGFSKKRHDRFCVSHALPPAVYYHDKPTTRIIPNTGFDRFIGCKFHRVIFVNVIILIG